MANKTYSFVMDDEGEVISATLDGQTFTVPEGLEENDLLTLQGALVRTNGTAIPQVYYDVDGNPITILPGESYRQDIHLNPNDLAKGTVIFTPDGSRCVNVLFRGRWLRVCV